VGYMPGQLGSARRMKTRQFVYLIAIGLLVLSACGAGGSPAIEGTRAWFQALADLRFDDVMNLTCANTAIRNEIGAKLDPFIDLKPTLAALKGQFDFSNLKFEEKSNAGGTAVIRLSVSMVLKALGQTEAMDVAEDIAVVNEGGTWKVCANPLKTP
jgi:hypothetical protein